MENTSKPPTKCCTNKTEWDTTTVLGPHDSLPSPLFWDPSQLETALALLAAQAWCHPAADMAVRSALSSCCGCWRGCSRCLRQHRGWARGTFHYALLGERWGRNPPNGAWVTPVELHGAGRCPSPRHCSESRLLQRRLGISLLKKLFK